MNFHEKRREPEHVCLACDLSVNVFACQPGEPVGKDENWRKWGRGKAREEVSGG